MLQRESAAMTMQPLLPAERRLLVILAGYDHGKFAFSTEVGEKCQREDWSSIPRLLELGFIIPYRCKDGSLTGRLIKITALGRSALEIDETMARSRSLPIRLADVISLVNLTCRGLI
jgi:hypothetical protein